SGGVEIFGFRRVPQVPAASVVERAEFCAACAGCGSEGHDAAVAGAAHGPESPYPARLLPRSRSTLACCATGGARSLRASPAPRAGEKFSWLDGGPAHHQHGPQTLL